MNPTYGTTLAQAANAAQTGIGNSPNGNAADIQHIQNAAAIDFRAGGVTGAQNAFGGAADTATKQATAARALAYSQEADARKIQAVKDSMASALTDPKNYQKQVSADGGYNFFKPDGTPISVLEYSQAVGKQVPDVLKGSQSSQDAQFTSDYKNLKLYGAAMTGDKTSLDAFTASKEGKAFIANPNNANKTYSEIVAAFKNHYGGYLQPDQANSMKPTNNTGQDVRSNIVGGSQAGMFSDWFNGRRNNVNYM